MSTTTTAGGPTPPTPPETDNLDDQTTAAGNLGESEDTYGIGGEPAEGHVYTVTGQDWDRLVSEHAERGDSCFWSTWDRSTRPPTGCCGWSSAPTARS